MYYLKRFYSFIKIKGPKKNRHDTDSGCHDGLKCMPISNCDTSISLETTFPCKNEDGIELVCCYDTNSTKTVAPVPLTTTTTAKTTTNAPKVTFIFFLI